MNFWQKWRKGMEDLTMEQGLYAKKVGMIGQMWGLVLAMIVMATSGFSYLLIFLGFTLFIIYVDYLGVKKQHKHIKQLIGGGKQ